MNRTEAPLDATPDAADPTTRTPAVRGPVCPQCGGPVDVRPESPITGCGHCRATLWLDLDRLVRHVVLRPRLGPAEARGALGRFLRAAEVDSAAAGPPPRLVFLPWWAVPAPGGVRVVGAAGESAFVTPPRRAAESGDADPAGADALRDAETIEPSVAFDEAVAAVDGGRGEGARLVHAPVWRIDYEDAGVRYVAHVDAVEGEVSALTLPPASTRKLDRSAIAWMAGAIALFAVEAAVLPGVLLPLLAFAATGALLYFLVRAGEKGPR